MSFLNVYGYITSEIDKRKQRMFSEKKNGKTYTKFQVKKGKVCVGSHGPERAYRRVRRATVTGSFICKQTTSE